MARRWILPPALALGGVWWWAVLRLALAPDHAGAVEGAIAAGGWGLSLLPVHVTSSRRRAGSRRAEGKTAGPERPPLAEGSSTALL
ncbi:hypothetical protein [Streptomyces sp. NPDC051569]|uniref:hypothetical protein n=1 Tax=Streptomyces sp. NPDC051569 TaxID=3365661 RepID=UPI0037A4CFCA